MDDFSAKSEKSRRTQTRHQLPVIIGPGFHESQLTQQWVRSLPSYTRYQVMDGFAASPVAAYDWLLANVGQPDDGSPAVPIVAIGFSAGVVGLAGALALWNQQGNQQGGEVARLIAVDGWGVPVIGVPVTRMSHDRFTHLSSLPLGAGENNWYASPGVDHLALWGEPEQAVGRSVKRWDIAPESGVAMSAATFLRQTLHAEWNRAFSWRTL